MVQNRIAESIQAALGLIQRGELDLALEQVDQALAMIKEPLCAAASQPGGNRQNPVAWAQRKLLIELHSHLTSAREAVSSQDPYSLASSRLSFALCQLQVAAPTSESD